MPRSTALAGAAWRSACCTCRSSIIYVPKSNSAARNAGTSVWYSYLAPASGRLFLDDCGASFDSLIGVYTGNAVNALTVRGADDDGCGRPASAVTLDVITGTTYRIEVAGSNGSGPQTGPFSLHWKLLPVVQVGDVQVVEGDMGTVDVAVPVRLSGPAAWPVTVNFATGNATALTPSDYIARSGAVTIPAGR